MDNSCKSLDAEKREVTSFNNNNKINNNKSYDEK